MIMNFGDPKAAYSNGMHSRTQLVDFIFQVCQGAILHIDSQDVAQAVEAAESLVSYFKTRDAESIHPIQS